MQFSKEFTRKKQLSAEERTKASILGGQCVLVPGLDSSVCDCRASVALGVLAVVWRRVAGSLLVKGLPFAVRHLRSNKWLVD